MNDKQKKKKRPEEESEEWDEWVSEPQIQSKEESERNVIFN
jgi:hypothetical protein